MKKVWKWIIGILIVLVVVAILVGGFFLIQTRTGMMRAARPGNLPTGQGQQTNPPNGQNVPNNPNDQGQPEGPGGPDGQNNPYGMRPGGFGHDNQGGGNEGRGGPMGPMMGGRGFRPGGWFMPFGMGMFFLGGLFRLIVPLGILVVVAFIFYRLGKRSGAAAGTPASPANTQATSAEPDKKAGKASKSK